MLYSDGAVLRLDSAKLREQLPDVLRSGILQHTSVPTCDSAVQSNPTHTRMATAAYSDSSFSEAMSTCLAATLLFSYS